jgi:hypothetical protein
MDLIRFLGYAAQTNGFGLAQSKKRSNTGLYSYFLALAVVLALCAWGCHSILTEEP